MGRAKGEQAGVGSGQKVLGMPGVASGTARRWRHAAQDVHGSMIQHWELRSLLFLGTAEPALQGLVGPATSFLKPRGVFLQARDPSPRVWGLALAVPICSRCISEVSA